jgi:high-affinity Fe2+/Pb2+ permease
MTRGRRVYPDSVSGEAKTAAYTIFGTLIAFKLVTALFVFWLQPTVHAAAFLTLTSVVWFALAAIPLLIGGAFWYRMVRARRKRKQLIYQEWNVAPRAESLPPGRPLAR